MDTHKRLMFFSKGQMLSPDGTTKSPDTTSAERRYNTFWTNEQTLSFINSRRRHQDLFTGRRQSAVEGYSAVLRDIGLEEVLSIEQAKKKWDNLVRKFRTLKTEKDEVETCIGVQTSTNWPFYEAMKKAITDRENEEEYDESPSPNCESSLETTPNITLKSEKNVYKPAVSQQNLKVIV